MKKYLVAAVAGGFVVVALYLLMLRQERTKTNDIFKKFNEADAMLDSLANARPEAGGGVGAIQESLSVTLTNSSSILLADSLIGLFEKKEINRPQLKEITAELLGNIKSVNKLKRLHVDSVMPDTISYWKAGIPFTYEKWLQQCFINNPTDSSLAYLKKLKAEIIRNNY